MDKRKSLIFCPLFLPLPYYSNNHIIKLKFEMNLNKILYWVLTGLVSALMLYSAFAYFTKPEMAEAFKHLGFPDFFRVELGTAKILGVAALLLPMVPGRIKELAYFGFAIVFVSALLAHYNAGDGIMIPALVALALLVVSYVYYHKLNDPIQA